MRIVHFSWEFPPVIFGGLGTFAMGITKKQRELGNEITVFSLNEQNKYKPLDTWNGITVYRPITPDITSALHSCINDELYQWGPNFKFFSDVVGYNLLSASQLVMLSSNNGNKPIDIIDAHDWLGILGGMVAKQALKKPLIFHVHSTEIGRSIGGGSKTIKNIEFNGGQVADGIITVSYAMKDELIHLGFPKEKIRVCWNGVDPEKYNPETISQQEKNTLRHSYGIKDDETMLFFIGRLVTVKGADKLIEAMPEVLQEFPKTKLVLLGIGDMQQDISNRINQLGLEKNIIFRNEFVNEKQRILHYASSDIVILPSLYEPFGIVCTEAMAMAKPVVVGARGTSGFREQIISYGKDQCGIHINPNDPHDIAWGIKQILSKEDKGLTMGHNGRHRAKTLFTWDVVTQRTHEIYNEFIQ
ncbi:MAG: glycosyltransferase family 4 protein [Thermoplasmatota archaeon]